MSVLWVAVAVQMAISSLNSPPIIRATIHEGCIYTSGVADREPDPRRTFGGGNLWLQKVDLKEGSPITSLEYMFGIGGRQNALLRWQLIKGQYYCVAWSWGSSETVSRDGHLQAVPLAAVELVNAIPRGADFYRNQYHWKYAKLIDSGPHLNPVTDATTWKDDSIKRQVFFDIWCRGDKQYEVYVTAPHKGNRLARGDFHPEWMRRTDQEKWEAVAEWTFDWTGPFYVTASGDDRYFVTDSGRVFVAPRGAKPGTPLKEIWKGKPVGALIHDADFKKWYAFTPDEYFEIADPIKLLPHSVPIRRASLVNDALDIAVKCGRVIRKLPEPKGK